MIRICHTTTRVFFLRVTGTVIFVLMGLGSFSHDIYFCGEKIPLDDKFVADKLMDIIKRQMGYFKVSIASMKKDIDRYMPQVEKYLQEANLPQDFKYLAIVESNFKTDAVSRVGATGFWQLMKGTAIQWNLQVNDLIDERKDFDKSTVAACREIARNYMYFRKQMNISSWVLTAAAYNFGTGNIRKTIKNQKETNYFSMDLNTETAEYVYKIIAVKELFEYPELYMKNFGYNVFNTLSPLTTTDVSLQSYHSLFSSVKFAVNESDDEHPKNLDQHYSRTSKKNPTVKITQVRATVVGKYKHIKDGDAVYLKLEDPINYKNNYYAKGQTLRTQAWIIDDRVMIDLGIDHNVILYDNSVKKGISLSEIKKSRPGVIIEISK